MVPWVMTRPRPWALAAFPILVASGIAAFGQGPGVKASDSRLLVVGLDGADWQIAAPLIEAGRLPHLGRLRGQGSWGDLRSDTITLSPLLWTTIATGKPPDQHGIIDFLVVDPASGRKVPIASTFRKTKALWNIYSEAGRTADFIGWWATWPAESVNGHIVSDRFAYSLFGYESRPEDAIGLVHPPEFIEVAAPLRVDDSELTLEDLGRFAPITAEEWSAARQKVEQDHAQAYADPINHLVRILASTRTYHALALKLLREGDADILGVYYQGIDEVCHRFAQYIPPKLAWVDAARFEKFKNVVSRYYEYQDELLGELLEAAGPDFNVVVLSDHGFLNGSDRPGFPPDIELKAGGWHRPYGLIVLAGAAIATARLEPVSLYDVAPTLLYLSGLPVAADMKGRPIQDVVKPELRASFRLASVPTYDSSPGAQSGATTGLPGSSAEVNAEILARLRSLGYITATDIAAGSSKDGGAVPATRTNLINLTAVQVASGQYALGEKTARSILEREPENTDALALLSEALEGQERLEEAFAASRTALNLAPEPSERQVGRFAVLAHNLGRKDEAKAFFLRYVQMRPGRAEPWLGLGSVQSMAADWEAAEASFLRALQINPRSPGAVTGLLNVFQRGDRSRQALASIEKGARANPDSAAHRTLLGMMYSSIGNPAGAETELREALKLEPDRDSAIAALADVLMNTGRPEEARELLERAVARRDDQVEVRMALGRLYSKMGRLGEALREMRRAAELEPGSASAHAQIGLILTMQNEAAGAVPHLERALALDPQLYEVRLHLAILHHETGNLAACETQLKKAIEQRPEDPEPHRLLGGLYMEVGRSEEAERELGRARELTASQPRP